jgi:hypothetical protein
MGHPAFAAGTGGGCESWPGNMPFFGLSGITQPLLLVQGAGVKAGVPMYRQQKVGAPFKPFFGLSGITQPLLLVQSSMREAVQPITACGLRHLLALCQSA